MRIILERSAPNELAKAAAEFIDAAVRTLPELPSEIPSYISDPGNTHAGMANEYLRRILMFDSDSANAAILEGVKSGLTIAETFQDILYPVQREIGRLWQVNEITALQEHFCSAAIDLLLAQLSRRFIPRDRSVRALALCPESEQHCIGLKMFAQLLEADGWAVNYIGANTPTASVIKLLRAERFELVAISVATALSLAGARNLIDAIRRERFATEPVILIDGLLLENEPAVWRTLRAHGGAATIVDGLDLANRLVSGRSDIQ